jgi:predicted TIM-barrel fold metal-dependent hydrolase
MSKKIPAIDFMYYVATPEFMEQWDRAKEGELVCRMEKAIGGLPRFASIGEMLAKMDEAGVEKVFITQCKMWSYWRKWMYMDTKLDDVLQYTEAYPDRFVGLAGYNPFRIKESLKEIELAVTTYGFKGVYVHIYGFDIPLNDAKMYPLFAKCVELDVPVSMQVGHVLEAMPSDGARPMYLDRIACDFPELKMIGAHTGWPWVDELLSVCYKWENIWFGIDAWLPKYLSHEIIRFMNSRLGADRCLWGTNGLPWKESLKQLCDLGLKEDVTRKIVRENAIELFKLESGKPLFDEKVDTIPLHV